VFFIRLKRLATILHFCHKTNPMSDAFQPPDPARFARAIQLFDDANSADPNQEIAEGRTWPRELLYARRLSEFVLALQPEASEALRLAARCQHLCRWESPRQNYPATRAGYLKWREELKKFHAAKAGEILQAAGYSEELVRRVQDLNLKRLLASGDPETAVLEDALCLVFLRYQLGELAARSDEAKMVNAIRKSWLKMSPAGRAAALKLPLNPRETDLVNQALQDPSGPPADVE
jgi:hypothetical protein